MLNRLEMMRIFCAAADAPSFKEASLRLAISPQAVTRAIKELEYSLGEPLFHRNTRQVRITEFGSRFAVQAKAAIAEIDSLFESRSHSRQDDYQGLVRITVPMGIGRCFLLPVLRKLTEDYPEIQFDLRLSDMIADVVDEQIDIGIRVGATLKDNRFIAKNPSKVAFLTVGTPGLIARVGMPRTPEDLLNMPTTGLLAPGSGRYWPWMFAQGQQLQMTQPVMVTNDAQLEVEAALQGIGFAQLPSCVAVPHIREGRLVSLLEDYAPEPWNLYVYRPQRGPVPPRIRVVYDYLVETLGREEVFPTAV